MPNPEEIAIIQGLRAGGKERSSFENKLWTLFSDITYWGITKYHLPEDEIWDAYSYTILHVITNIVTGRYKEAPDTLLRTYTAAIFHHKCMDRIGMTSKHPNTKYLKKPQTIEGGLSNMLPDNVKNVVEEIIQREDRLRLKKCLDQMGEPCKRLLLLYASKYKDREIAGIMGYSSSDVVKKTRQRCMEKLRRYYINLYNNE